MQLCCGQLWWLLPLRVQLMVMAGMPRSEQEHDMVVGRAMAAGRMVMQRMVAACAQIQSEDSMSWRHA